MLFAATRRIAANLFPPFTEVLTVAIVTSKFESMSWQDFTEGNHSRLALLQSSSANFPFGGVRGVKGASYIVIRFDKNPRFYHNIEIHLEFVCENNYY